MSLSLGPAVELSMMYLAAVREPRSAAPDYIIIPKPVI